MSDTFHTLKAPSEGIYKEKMSKFLSFAHPVCSAEEARNIIKRYQKDYFDARHVCWAYMIGASRTEFMSNDNGEPSGTAGRPILGQINSFGLTNIVIIVVRYFGGIKLGAGGLTRAYGGSAKLLKPFYVDKLQELEFQTDICNGDRLFKYLNNHNIKYDKQFNDKLYVKIYANDFEKIKVDLDFIDFNK